MVMINPFTEDVNYWQQHVGGLTFVRHCKAGLTLHDFELATPCDYLTRYDVVTTSRSLRPSAIASVANIKPGIHVATI